MEAIIYLKDSATGAKLRLRVRQRNGALELMPKGYGVIDTVDGKGVPLIVEFHDGKLQVVLAPDINSEDLTIIPMENALESSREDLEPEV